MSRMTLWHGVVGCRRSCHCRTECHTGRRAELPGEADQDDGAVHAGIAGRRAGAAGHATCSAPRLGQTIVIDNRPGAGTTLGTKVAASADPDGYTLMIAATSFVISSVMYPNPGYDPLKSFAPVACWRAARRCW